MGMDSGCLRVKALSLPHISLVTDEPDMFASWRVGFNFASQAVNQVEQQFSVIGRVLIPYAVEQEIRL